MPYRFYFFTLHEGNFQTLRKAEIIVVTFKHYHLVSTSRSLFSLFLAALVFVAAHGLSRVVASEGHSVVGVHGLLLIALTFLVAEHEF